MRCHETTARAARLERGVSVTLRQIGFSGLLDVPGSQHDVASAAATPLRTKGQRGFVLGGAWRRVDVLRSFTQQDNAAQATQGGCR